MPQAPQIPVNSPKISPKNPSRTPKNSTTLKFNKIPPQNPQNHQNPQATPQKFFVCHTELSQESEVSTNFKVCLKFFGYFAFLQKAQNDKSGVDFLHGYALQAAWLLRLKMTKKNKTQMTAHCLFDENKLTAKKSFIPAKPLEFSKETKAVLWLFA